MLIFSLFILFYQGNAGADLTPEVTRFLKTMQSQQLPLARRSPLYNHYYKSPVDRTTAIVFLPGMSEPALKYYDLVQDLNSLNATIYLWDHIGQGFSYHFLPQEREKVFIDSFDTHLAALEGFLERIHPQHSEVYVVGHSMGGHLALRLARRRPELIQKIAVTAPLIEINSPYLPLHWFTWAFGLLPATKCPPFYPSIKNNTSITQSLVTHSEERLKIYESTLRVYPAIKRLGATWGWIHAALRSSEEMAKEDYQNLSTPVLMLQAEEEHLVDNESQRWFCRRLKACELKIIAQAKHEILFEKDPQRNQAMNEIVSFFSPKQRSPASSLSSSAIFESR